MRIGDVVTTYSKAMMAFIGTVCDWATENFLFVAVSVTLILAGLGIFIKQGRCPAGKKKNSAGSSSSKKQPTARSTASISVKQLDVDSSAQASPI